MMIIVGITLYHDMMLAISLILPAWQLPVMTVATSAIMILPKPSTAIPAGNTTRSSGRFPGAASLRLNFKLKNMIPKPINTAVKAHCGRPESPDSSEQPQLQVEPEGHPACPRDTVIPVTRRTVMSAVLAGAAAIPAAAVFGNVPPRFARATCRVRLL